MMWRSPPSSSMAFSASSGGSALPCQPSLFSSERDALALDRPGDDAASGRPCGARPRRRPRRSASRSWPSISMACQPKARGARGVGVAVPAQLGLAALAQAVHVDDGDQVAELVVRGVVEAPPRPSPRPSRCRPAAPRCGRAACRGTCRPARCRRRSAGPGPSEPVATSTHGMIGRGVALQAAAELAQRQHLLVGDRARRLVDGVEQRRGVALGEDQVVVGAGCADRRSRSAGIWPAARPSGRRPTSTRWGGRSRPWWWQRMLSTRSCCASSCHCAVPVAGWAVWVVMWCAS